MRFPLLDRLDLPCVIAGIVPGQLHPDGHRYLPQLLLRPTGDDGLLPAGLLLSVVDRHHRVDEGATGRPGSARLVCALSTLRLQKASPRLGLLPEEGWHGGVSRAPLILGRVLDVAAWEEGSGQLPYQAVYVELALDIGFGVVGLRTSLTADNLAGAIGKGRIEPDDYVELSRSRIDILAFERQTLPGYSGERDG